jgi:hypothetical protein
VEDEDHTEEMGGGTTPFRILLDVLCCMMVADGRASKSERIVLV